MKSFIQFLTYFRIIASPGIFFFIVVSNDFGFKFVFQRGVEAYGQKGDLFIGLTTSGNSENIKLALDEAKNATQLKSQFIAKKIVLNQNQVATSTASAATKTLEATSAV